MSHDNDLFTTLDGLTSAEEKVAHSFENLTINELETLLRQEGLTKKASASEDKEYKRLAKGHGRIGAVAGAVNGAMAGSLKGGAGSALAGGALGAGAGYLGGRASHWMAGKVSPKDKKASAEPTLEEKVKQADAMGRQMAHNDYKTKDLIGKADLEKVALGLSNMGAMAGKAVNAIKSNPMARNAAMGAAGGAVLGAAKTPPQGGSRLGGALKGGVAGGAIGAASGNAKVQSMARAGLDRAKNVAGATAFRAGQAMGKK